LEASIVHDNEKVILTHLFVFEYWQRTETVLKLRDGLKNCEKSFFLSLNVGIIALEL